MACSFFNGQYRPAMFSIREAKKTTNRRYMTMHVNQMESNTQVKQSLMKLIFVIWTSNFAFKSHI